MGKKNFNAISFLALTCFLYLIYDAYRLSVIFEKPFMYFIFDVNLSLIVFYLALSVVSFYKNFKWMIGVLAIEIIWSHLFDPMCILRWAITSLYQKIFLNFDQISIFFPVSLHYVF